MDTSAQPMHASLLTTQQERFLPWLIAATFFMQMLDTTIVNTAIPSIAESLNVSPLKMQSVSISYVLTVALLIPVSGWLTDRFGMRHIFLFAIILFSLGSLACAAALSLNQLVAARVLQGVGGALLTPVGRLCILRAYPKDQLVQVLSFVSIPALLGPLIGPTLGGALSSYISWHWIFLINLPVGALAILGTIKLMPDLPLPDKPSPFDWPGFILFSISMLTLTLAIQGIGELKLPLHYILLCLITGFTCLAVCGVYFSHVPTPLFNPKIFSTRNFSIGIIGNIVARLGLSAIPFLAPLFLQVGLGYSPMQAGMLLIPITIGAIAGKKIASPLLSKFGYRLMLTINTALLGILIASFSCLTAQDSVYSICTLLGIFGFINSIQFTFMNTLTLIDLPPKLTGTGNSILSVVMQMGVGISVATAATLLGVFSDLSNILHAFIATFWCLGALTLLSSVIFLQVHRTGISGSEPKNSSHKER